MHEVQQNNCNYTSQTFGTAATAIHKHMEMPRLVAGICEQTKLTIV
jgi:hypothetical protein